MKLRRSAIVAFTLALTVVGAALLTNVVPYKQILDQQHQVEAAAAELEALRDENDMLEARRDSLQTPVEIERLAREKLGYVRPGEVAYVVLEPPSLPAANPVGEPRSGAAGGADAAEPVEDESLFDSVWDFVTGADVSG